MPYKIPIFLDRLSTIYSWSKFIKNQDFKMLHLINVKKFKIEIGIEGIFVMTSKWLASFGINKPKRNVMSCDWDSHIFECWGNSRFLEIVIISNVGVMIVYINESFARYFESVLISDFFLLWLHLQRNVPNHYPEHILLRTR